MTKKRRREWIFCIVAGLLCVGLSCIPTEMTRLGQAAAERVKVRVESVDNTMLAPLGIVYSGSQTATVRIESGEYNGKTVVGYNHLNSAMEKDKLFEPGDQALAMIHTKDGKISFVTLIDHYRMETQGLLLGLFGVLLIVFGGVSGCGALISLVMSVMVVWKLLIPALLTGFSPIWCSLAVVVILTVMIDLLVAGFTRTALIAMIGSLLGTALTCVLSVTFGTLLKLDGSSLPYVIPILAQSHLQFNLREIFFSMVFIANSGALMDLSMDIASTCEELRWHNPELSRKNLIRSGFAVGKHVVGTMTTTLMLAYSGSYLSLLMYFAGQGTPVIDILNVKYVASEILTTLVGSFGLVTVAPFTAIVAGLFLRARKEDVPAAFQVQPHENG